MYQQPHQMELIKTLNSHVNSDPFTQKWIKKSFFYFRTADEEGLWRLFRLQVFIVLNNGIIIMGNLWPMLGLNGKLFWKPNEFLFLYMCV